MICPRCGYKNDADASFCEKCGKSLKDEGLSRTGKIVLAVCIVLVAVLGLSAGIFVKSSQQPAVLNTSNGSVASGISQSTGFPVTEAPKLASEISKYNGTVGSVNYGFVKLDKNQCIYLLARSIAVLNRGENGSIPIKNYSSPENPEGYVSSAVITKSEYVDMASRTYTWMDREGSAPNYVGITKAGQPDLSPDTTLELFSKVLAQYDATGELPGSVTIP